MRALRWLRGIIMPDYWRCCDWCDHERCTITPDRCKSQCVHWSCMGYPD